MYVYTYKLNICRYDIKFKQEILEHRYKVKKKLTCIHILQYIYSRSIMKNIIFLLTFTASNVNQTQSILFN